MSGQGGLSLPDRDYYLKTDAKSVEIRQRFLQHVQKMFQLAGDSGRNSPTVKAKQVMDDREYRGQRVDRPRFPARSKPELSHHDRSPN